MLDPADERAVADQFGVARPQVHRDHLISHLLAAISDHLADDVLFFGGTALSRTHAPDGRLSEDIDLIALDNRRTTAERLETTLVRATRREYPGLRWQPALSAVRDATPAILATPEGITAVRPSARRGHLAPSDRRPNPTSHHRYRRSHQRPQRLAGNRGVPLPARQTMTPLMTPNPGHHRCSGDSRDDVWSDPAERAS